MAYAMGSRFLDRAAGMDAAVQVDYVVVANGVEAPGAVPTVQVLDGKVAAGGGGAAVDYDFCYFSHCLVF